MFQPGMYMHISQDDVEDFSTEKTFGVCAWLLPNNKNWIDNLPEALPYLEMTEAHSETFTIAKANAITDIFWIVNDNTWKAGNENLAFFAYAPFEIPCSCTPSKGIACSLDILKEQSDLLYTDPQSFKQQTSQGWLIPLTFKHALSQIQFRVCNRVAQDEKIILKSLTLENVKFKGDFASLRIPQWIPEQETTSLVFHQNIDTITRQPIFVGNKLVIPQILDSKVTIEYDYISASGNIIEQKLQTDIIKTNLNSGNSYIYTISVGKNDVKFQEENITHHLNASEEDDEYTQ